MEGKTVLALLSEDGLEDDEHSWLVEHLTELVGPTHLPAAWIAANDALNAGVGSGDWSRSIEVRPAMWATALQVVEGLKLEQFCKGEYGHALPAA